MTIIMTQICEMCGISRDLPTTSARPKMPQPDSGGWRVLNSGSKEATLCNGCILIVVSHARRRAEVRSVGGDPNTINDQPFVLQFFERRA